MSRKGYILLYQDKYPGCFKLMVLLPKAEEAISMYADEEPSGGSVVCVHKASRLYRVAPKADHEVGSELVLEPIDAVEEEF